MPGYIAWVYVYGLSTQLAQADGTFNRWNEEGFRQTYYKQLVAGVDSIMQVVEPVEAEPAVNTFDEVASDNDQDAEEEGTSTEEQPPVSEPQVTPMKATRGRPSKV